MPATRARTRILEERKSSDPATSPSELPMPEFNFAPNVTPLTYTCDSETADEDNSSPECLDMSEMRFPPSSSKPNSARRRRKNDGKIPRPPNAFMLFRSEFVRQQHIPGSIETNRTSLSKIIGSCWKLLPEEEKAVWYKRAKAATAEHKRIYPDYRFRPIHGKKKKGQTERGQKPSTVASKTRIEPLINDAPQTVYDKEKIIELRKEREEFIARCLTREGKKGDELKSAVARWEREHGWEEGFLKIDVAGTPSPVDCLSPAPIVIPTLLPILSQSFSNPPSRSHSVAPSAYSSRRPSPVPLLYNAHGQPSSRPASRLAHVSQTYDSSSPLLRPSLASHHSLVPLYPPTQTTLHLPQVTRESLFQQRFASSLDFETNGRLCYVPVEEQYHGEPFLNFPFAQTYHIDPSENSPNKMSLDFLDSCRAAVPFISIHTPPLSDIVSEISSRPSTTYTGSPAPMDREDFQIQASKTMPPLTSATAEEPIQNSCAVNTSSGTVVERSMDVTTSACGDQDEEHIAGYSTEGYQFPAHSSSEAPPMSVPERGNNLSSSAPSPNCGSTLDELWSGIISSPRMPSMELDPSGASIEYQ